MPGEDFPLATSVNAARRSKPLTPRAIGLLVSSPVVLAGFQVVYEGAAPKPLAPVQVVTATHENAHLRAELNRLSAELAQVKIVVSFAFGNTEFVPQPEVAEKIVTYAKLAGTVNVRDYTDSVGMPAANQRVALQRAIAAKQYLISWGVEEMKVKVFGRTREYVASNATEAGRLANRRVEIDFLP